MSKSRFTCLTFLLLAWVLVLPGAPLRAQSAPCQQITDAEVARLFDRWNDSLGTLDPDKVVANYAATASLLPTVQNGPLVGRDAIRGYFVTFLADHPHGTINRRLITRGCNIVYDIGLYTFTYQGKPPTKARYTFIYEYEPDGKTWLIVHHHSSKQPVSTP